MISPGPQCQHNWHLINCSFYEKKSQKTQRIRTSRFFSHSSVAHNLLGVREERRVSVWGIERVFLSNSFWAIWCRTFFTRLILRVGNKPWNQLSLHMLRGRGKTHRQTWLSSQIMFVSFRLHHFSSFCASHLARSLVFPPLTQASRGTRPRSSLQATPPTPPPPKKTKNKKTSRINAAAHSWAALYRPPPLSVFVITVQQEERFHTGFPFSSRLYISPAPSGVPFWRRFDFPHSYIYLS